MIIDRYNCVTISIYFFLKKKIIYLSNLEIEKIEIEFHRARSTSLFRNCQPRWSTAFSSNSARSKNIFPDAAPMHARLTRDLTRQPSFTSAANNWTQLLGRGVVCNYFWKGHGVNSLCSIALRNHCVKASSIYREICRLMAYR